MDNKGLSKVDRKARGRTPQIREYAELEQVEELAERYARLYGRPPLDLSHWDASPEFRSSLKLQFTIDSTTDALDYIYSYGLDFKDAILRGLGFDPERKSCLVTPSGTASMLCAVNWLAFRSKSLDLLCPYYFPVAHQAERDNIVIRKYFMRRDGGRYFLPDEVLGSPETPVWLSNPVYCTGATLTQHDIGRLQRHLENGGTIVADECLSPCSSNLAGALASLPGFVGLYCPHKGINVNGVKFSVVVFDRSDAHFFDQWADVLYGGLPASSLIAIKHYLSSDYARYSAEFFAGVRKTLSAIEEMVEDFPVGQLDIAPVGHFVSFYVPVLESTLGIDQAFMWDLISASGAVVISGARNHFDPRCGFSFRLNLARDSAQFRSAFGRLLRFLEVSQQHL
jgi:hypothetical protein